MAIIQTLKSEDKFLDSVGKALKQIGEENKEAGRKKILLEILQHLNTNYKDFMSHKYLKYSTEWGYLLLWWIGYRWEHSWISHTVIPEDFVPWPPKSISIQDKRPSEDEYFSEIARVVATRSTCAKHQVGCVLVCDKQIISTGYNGAPRGVPHCTDIGCKRPDSKHGEGYENCMAVHAETNAIIQAALHGTSTSGSTIYCTHQPCLQCAKMLINAGVVRVVYEEHLGMKVPLELLHSVGINTSHFG